MKMIKWLQLAVVVMFVIMVVAGLLVLALAEQKMGAFKELVYIIFPVFLTMVVPALIGSPLTDYVRARAARLAGSPADPPTPAGDGPPEAGA